MRSRGRSKHLPLPRRTCQCRGRRLEGRTGGRERSPTGAPYCTYSFTDSVGPGPTMGFAGGTTTVNRPTTESFAFIAEVWHADGQLDWFAAWLWTTGHRDYLPSPNTPNRDDVLADRDWLDRVATQIEQAGAPSPFGGGYDPLHLGAHISEPLQPPRRGPSEVRVDERSRGATFVLDSMAGWYALVCGVGEALPEEGFGWTVDVVATPVGWLGTYRRSPKTGLWYCGRHADHVAGN